MGGEIATLAIFTSQRVPSGVFFGLSAHGTAMSKDSSCRETCAFKLLSWWEMSASTASRYASAAKYKPHAVRIDTSQIFLNNVIIG